MRFHPIAYFKKNVLPYIIAYTAKYCIRLIFWSCKKEVHGVDNFIKIAKENRCILMLWHNNLTLMHEIVHNYAPLAIYSAFISNSRDGEPLAILTRSYTLGRVHRVPHNQRHAALHGMIARLRDHKEIAVITPDGPRGPKYVLKPGVVLAAKATGAHIVPISWNASRFWQLRTWDSMKIPKPFSKISITFGPSITIKEDLPDDEAIKILQNALENMTRGQA